MKKGTFRIYFVVVHVLLVTLIFTLAYAIHRIRADRRMPGSRLAATYTNNDDDWWHYILHDGRDPVAAVHDRNFGVDTIVVSPPGSTLVWQWRREAGKDWKLLVSEYATPQQADRHTDASHIRRLLVDGDEDNPMDGYPDRELVISGSARTAYSLSPPQREAVPEESNKPAP